MPTISSPRSMLYGAEACSLCHLICMQGAMDYCRQSGNRRVEPAHFKLLASCSEICQACANLQLIQSPYSYELCRLCAEICEACARSCEQIGGMDDCVEACQVCAESCRNVA